MVSKPRLLKAERPQRGKWGWACEPGVGGQDVLCVGPVEDVVVERASLRAKGVGVWGFFAKIEARPPGVVEEYAGGDPPTRRQEKGNCFVDGIGGFLKVITVSVPQVIGVVSPVEGTRLVAQSEVVVLRSHRLV